MTTQRILNKTLELIFLETKKNRKEGSREITYQLQPHEFSSSMGKLFVRRQSLFHWRHRLNQSRNHTAHPCHFHANPFHPVNDLTLADLRRANHPVRKHKKNITLNTHKIKIKIKKSQQKRTFEKCIFYAQVNIFGKNFYYHNQTESNIFFDDVNCSGRFDRSWKTHKLQLEH